MRITAPRLFAILLALLSALSTTSCSTPNDVRHDPEKPVRNDGGGY